MRDFQIHARRVGDVEVANSAGVALNNGGMLLYRRDNRARGGDRVIQSIAKLQAEEGATLILNACGTTCV